MTARGADSATPCEVPPPTTSRCRQPARAAGGSRTGIRGGCGWRGEHGAARPVRLAVAEPERGADPWPERRLGVSAVQRRQLGVRHVADPQGVRRQLVTAQRADPAADLLDAGQLAVVDRAGAGRSRREPDVGCPGRRRRLPPRRGRSVASRSAARPRRGARARRARGRSRATRRSGQSVVDGGLRVDRRDAKG